MGGSSCIANSFSTLLEVVINMQPAYGMCGYGPQAVQPAFAMQLYGGGGVPVQAACAPQAAATTAMSAGYQQGVQDAYAQQAYAQQAYAQQAHAQQAQAQVQAQAQAQAQQQAYGAQMMASPSYAPHAYAFAPQVAAPAASAYSYSQTPNAISVTGPDLNRNGIPDILEQPGYGGQPAFGAQPAYGVQGYGAGVQATPPAYGMQAYGMPAGSGAIPMTMPLGSATIPMGYTLGTTAGYATPGVAGFVQNPSYVAPLL